MKLLMEMVFRRMLTRALLAAVFAIHSGIVVAKGKPEAGDTSGNGGRKYNLDVALYGMTNESGKYRWRTNAEREKVTSALTNFAYCVYEMTDGIHRLGTITVYELGKGEPLPKADCDIIWEKQLAYNGNAIGDVDGWAPCRTSSTRGAIHVADYSTKGTPNIDNPMKLGAILAHEWGHAEYGFGEEYDGTYTQFKDGGKGLIMGNAWAGKDNPSFDMLNLSIPADVAEAASDRAKYFVATDSTQYKRWGQSCWESLIVPNYRSGEIFIEEPTPGKYVRIKPPYHHEFNEFKIKTYDYDQHIYRQEWYGRCATVDLPAAKSTALKDFEIVWKKGCQKNKCMFVDDASGSMSDTDWANASSQVQLLVQSVPEGTVVGFMTFSDRDKIETVVPLTEVTETNRSAIKEKIAAARKSNGNTALWEAAWQALDAIETYSAGDEDDTENFNAGIILLTDGDDNDSTKTRNEVVARCKDMGVSFNSVAYGSNAESSLPSASEETGGSYHSSGKDATEVGQAFLRSFAASFGKTTLADYTYQLTKPTQIMRSFFVDSSLTNLVVSVGVATADEDDLVRLVSPSGSPIIGERQKSEDGCTTIFHISAPECGEWTLEAAIINSSRVTLYADANLLDFDMSLDAIVRAGDGFLTVTLCDEHAIMGAEVVATVSGNGYSREITLNNGEYLGDYKVPLVDLGPDIVVNGLTLTATLRKGEAYIDFDDGLVCDIDVSGTKQLLESKTRVRHISSEEIVAALSGFSFPGECGYAEDIAARQEDGVIAIEWTLKSWQPGLSVMAVVNGRDTRNNISVNAVSIIGDGVSSPAKEGVNRLYWNIRRDYSDYQEDSFDVSVSILPLLIPASVTATQGDEDGVIISWCGNAAQYEIWRGPSDDVSLASKLDVLTGNLYADNTAVPGSSYWYWVRPLLCGNVGEFGISAYGYRACPAPTGVSASTAYTDCVEVTWNSVAYAQEYHVYRSETASSADAVKIYMTPGTTYMDVTATVGKRYYYWVKAVGESRSSDFSGHAEGYRVPSVPTGVSATDGTFRGGIVVSWTMVSGAERYNVYRSESASNLSAVKIGDAKGTVFYDISAVENRNYFYWVKAAGEDVEGDFSLADTGWRRATITGNAPFVVIDLSQGPSASRFPCYEMWSKPSKWTKEYKTDKLVLKRITPGSFLMGSPSNEIGRNDNDFSQHSVSISDPYYIGVFEVTIKQWNNIGATGAPGYTGQSDAHPACIVRYICARGNTLGDIGGDTLIGKLREKVGIGNAFDLPTEAQWEFACRAGTTTSINNGYNLASASAGEDANMSKVARYSGNGGLNAFYTTGLAEVGSYDPNSWGLYDMHGNVAEWCSDLYDVDRWMMAALRGGNHRSAAKNCRSASRYLQPIDWGTDYEGDVLGNCGVRVVLNVSDVDNGDEGPIKPDIAVVEDYDGVHLSWDNILAKSVKVYYSDSPDMNSPKEYNGGVCCGRTRWFNGWTDYGTYPGKARYYQVEFTNTDGGVVLSDVVSGTRKKGRLKLIVNGAWVEGCEYGAPESKDDVGALVDGVLTFPDGIQGIDDGYRGRFDADSIRHLIDKIVLPDSLRTLIASFRYCENLKEVVGGKNIKEVFSECDGGISSVFDGTPFVDDDSQNPGVVYVGNCAVGFRGRNTIWDRFWDWGDEYAGGHDDWSGWKCDLVLRSGTICASGFYDLPLTSVTLPESLKYIQDCTFHSWYEYDAEDYPGYMGLTEVTLPLAVEYIGDDAFKGWSNLSRAVFLGWGQGFADLFPVDCEIESRGVYKLVVINGIVDGWHLVVGTNTERGDIVDGVLIIPDGAVVVADVTRNRENVCVQLPDFLEEVRELVIPNSVTSIGDGAFESCDGLRSVVIPDSVTSIGNWAFAWCDGLTSVVIPDSVTNVGDGAFACCDALTSVVIPDSVTNIGDGAFKECYGLTSVVIPDSVTSIGDWTFLGCYGLTSVVIPDSVTNIGDYAFEECYGLTSVVIPNSVTSIGAGAFSFCGNLTRVTIGKNVTRIGEGAFVCCNSLSDIVFLGDAPAFVEYAFKPSVDYLDGVSPDCVIHVKQGSTGWGVDIPGVWNGLRIEYIDGSTTFAVVAIVAYGCKGMGNVSGGGKEVKPGTKVTLKATANKGHVFVGWRQDNGEWLSQESSYSYKVGEEDVVFTAYFATAGDDEKSLKVNVADVPTEADGTVSLDLGACVESLSQPKITVKGLPSGLKFDAKTGEISGKATKPGVYKVTVSATNKTVTKPVTATFDIVVPNLESDVLANLEPGTEAYGKIVCGVAFDPGLVDCAPEDGWTLKAAGLPAGLKLVQDKATGAYSITGVPTKAGTFTVTFTASKKGEANQTATITLNVEAAPEWAVGTFTGSVTGNGEWGTASMTVAANGKISGKIALGGTNWTFKADSFNRVVLGNGELGTGNGDTTFVINAVATAGKVKRAMELRVEAADSGCGLVNAKATGESDDGEWSLALWRGMWKDKATAAAAKAEIAKWEGVYTVSLDPGADYGSGYLSLTVGKDGNVKATGKLADGTSASATSPLMYDENDGWFAYLYAAPSAYKGGAFAAAVGFDGPRGAALPCGPAQWSSRNIQATGEYGAGFDREVSFVGAYYNKLDTLRKYYESLRVSFDGVPKLGYVYKETYLNDLGRKTTDSENMEAEAIDTLGQVGMTVDVNEKGAIVVKKATKPVQDKETKVWSYDGVNDGALALSFTQATGIFKGSYTFWYDYESAYDLTTYKSTMSHTSKKVSFEGIMVQGENSMRGFYLWDALGVYDDPKTGREKTYKYKESYPVYLVSP